MSNDVNVSLYAPDQERDACGTGFAADIACTLTLGVFEMALAGVMNLTHRGALAAGAACGGWLRITGREETCPIPRG